MNHQGNDGREQWNRPEAEQDNSLSGLMDRCGHYFVHRTGGSRRGQGQVMAMLSQTPNLSQKDLAEALGVIPASLGEILAKLEHKGLVERSRDENDRRILRVRLTPEGEKSLAELEPVSDDPFQTLSPEEKETLTQLLTKLLADWEVRYHSERKRQGGRRGGRSMRDGEFPGRGEGRPGRGGGRPMRDGEFPGRGEGRPGRGGGRPMRGGGRPEHSTEFPEDQDGERLDHDQQ